MLVVWWLGNLIGSAFALLGFVQMRKPTFLPTRVNVTKSVSRNEHRAGGLVIALFGWSIISTSEAQLLESRFTADMATCSWLLLSVLILAVAGSITVSAIIPLGVALFRRQARREFLCGGIHSQYMPTPKQMRVEANLFTFAFCGLVCIPVLVAMGWIGSQR